MSGRAHYLCPSHGRFAIRTTGRAEDFAPCPTCSGEIKRAPGGRPHGRSIQVSVATYERLRRHAELAGKSIKDLVDVWVQGLGGKP